MSNITILLDTKVEIKAFNDVIAGLVERGIIFNCTITGTKAVITLTGGF